MPKAKNKPPTTELRTNSVCDTTKVAGRSIFKHYNELTLSIARFKDFALGLRLDMPHEAAIGDRLDMTAKILFRGCGKDLRVFHINQGVSSLVNGPLACVLRLLKPDIPHDLKLVIQAYVLQTGYEKNRVDFRAGSIYGERISKKPHFEEYAQEVSAAINRGHRYRELAQIGSERADSTLAITDTQSDRLLSRALRHHPFFKLRNGQLKYRLTLLCDEIPGQNIRHATILSRYDLFTELKKVFHQLEEEPVGDGIHRLVEATQEAISWLSGPDWQPWKLLSYLHGEKYDIPWSCVPLLYPFCEKFVLTAMIAAQGQPIRILQGDPEYEWMTRELGQRYTPPATTQPHADDYISEAEDDDDRLWNYDITMGPIRRNPAVLERAACKSNRNTAEEEALREDSGSVHSEDNVQHDINLQIENEAQGSSAVTSTEDSSATGSAITTPPSGRDPNVNLAFSVKTDPDESEDVLLLATSEVTNEPGPARPDSQPSLTVQGKETTHPGTDQSTTLSTTLRDGQVTTRGAAAQEATTRKETTREAVDTAVHAEADSEDEFIVQLDKLREDVVQMRPEVAKDINESRARIDRLVEKQARLATLDTQFLQLREVYTAQRKRKRESDEEEHRRQRQKLEDDERQRREEELRQLREDQERCSEIMARIEERRKELET